MSFSAFDHQCMAVALRLARKGLYTTDPNPRVGCVISTDNRVIGSGWHQVAGGAHAEIVALEQAGSAARGGTAYVTLEPCSHHGRTPPCSDALLAAGVGRVVVAVRDPNPNVNGSGLSALSDAGVKVEHGLMADQAEALNAGFLMRMRAGRPWVRIKSAISLDGRTALGNGDSKWISSEASRRDVQHWRARSSAILTGIGTVLADDPSMNARIDGNVQQPLRVIADTRWRTPPQARMLAVPGQVIIAGSQDLPVPPVLLDSQARCVPVPARSQGIELPALLQMLAGLEINELQVEAGSKLAGALLEAQLVDEILIYQAPVLLGSGSAGVFAFGPLESMADRTHLNIVETLRLDSDLRIRLQPETGH